MFHEDDSGSVAPPPETPRNSTRWFASWAIAAAVVLILAVAGGLLTAWLVANSQSVPGPVAFASPTPGFSQQVASPTADASGGPSAEPTDGPRRTPTPAATPEVTPAPFVYVVQAGDHLVNIADMFAVDVQDIIDLNDIQNQNKIFVGQELLIPGYGIQPTPKPSKKPR